MGLGSTGARPPYFELGFGFRFVGESWNWSSTPQGGRLGYDRLLGAFLLAMKEWRRERLAGCLNSELEHPRGYRYACGMHIYT